MRFPALALAASALAFVNPVAAKPAKPDPVPPADTAWRILEDLTTEIGPRIAGSDREAAARDWAVARLKALGFSNPRIEPFTLRGFVRGAETARILAPYPQPLAITALGYSVPTPAGGIEAELVYFASLDALKAAPERSLKGKIAFIDHAMKANQDGSAYGPSGAVRRQGPRIASQKGALAVVIRSVGTDSHRNPHTGNTAFGDATPIPAGAVSLPDAEQIARIAAKGQPVRLALTLTGYPQDNMPSGNVLAELPGRDPGLPPVLVACHLDSWDLGTGAFDDAAGCAIVTAAALRAQQGGKPLRTIRVLWAGSEEIGVFGGAAYGQAHAGEPHALAMESDFGADRVYGLRTSFARTNPALRDRLVAALAPMGVVDYGADARGGADIGAIVEAQKLPVIDLMQDGTRYFDLHHTPDDTLDKVDRAQFEQNVAVWAATLKIVANEARPLAGAKQD
ncbi:Zn-dependent M28 family amino/carboxypeptidase [Novosphingobium kunmingense]|uniref:Carboxypeptidase Q n=1 Tax=Novosphingobium kunmingense TaxID=1211806 RepID=A0A2N0I1M6_9SPHN|nr:M28 family peptidase [Novosphingobium kunmingense]PKB25098.1 Zn-dependent M28 family amino/carboxypeptidase [Novosphingobium kunmingense]